MLEPPALCNIEAEAALLGAMMQEARVVDPVADRVDAADFMEPLHGRIFSAIVGQHSLGKLANPVTLKPFFENDSAMRDVGGAGYLAQLTGSGAAVIGARDFADQVRELSRRRALVEGMTGAIAAANDCDLTLDAIVAKAEDALNAVRPCNESRTEFTAGEALKLSLDDLGKPQRGVLCSRIRAYDALLGPKCLQHARHPSRIQAGYGSATSRAVQHCHVSDSRPAPTAPHAWYGWRPPDLRAVGRGQKHDRSCI